MRGNRDRWIYSLILGLGVLLIGYPLRQAIGIVPDCPECTFWNGYYCQQAWWAECTGYWCDNCCRCQNCQCVEEEGSCPGVGSCSRGCEKYWGYCVCQYCKCWEPNEPIGALAYDFDAAMCTPYKVTVDNPRDPDSYTEPWGSKEISYDWLT